MTECNEIKDPITNGKTACVILKPEVNNLKVGGLGFEERWQKAMGVNQIPAKEISDSEIRDILHNTSSSILLVEANAVLDDESIGKIASFPCSENDIVTFKDDKSTFIPLILMGKNAARTATEIDGIGWEDLSSVAESLSKHRELSFRTESVYRLFFHKVTDRQSADSATWGLLKHLRYRYGGLIAKVVNRNVSMVITRALLWTKITPNMITTFAGILALLSIYLLTLGEYTWALTATGIMQLSSILDGTDGEIAKIKFQFSKFGKWYDSIFDETNDALFIAAIGYHSYLVHDFFYFFLMGIFAGAVSFLYALVNWHTKAKYGHGVYWWFDKVGTRALSEREPSLGKQWKTLFGRDAYILFSVVLAATNLLSLLVVVMSCVSVVILSMLFIHIVIKRAKW